MKQKSRRDEEQALGNCINENVNRILDKDGEQITDSSAWEMTCIKDVCESIIDCVNKTAPTTSYPTPYKMIRTNNVKSGHINLSDVKYVTKEVFEIWTRRMIPKKGDVILTREAPLGEVGMIRTDDLIFLGQRLMQYRANPEYLDNRYLLYAFQEHSFQEQVKLLGSGATVEHMRVPDAEKLMLRLPPLSEQQAIATALSDVDALITSLDQHIAKKRDIKQATMQQLLTSKRRLSGFSGKWKVKKLGEIFEFLSTAHNSRSDLSKYGEIKYIHYGDIHTKWRSFLDCANDELPLIQRDKVRNVPFLEDGDLVMADASEDYEGIGISVEVKNATGRQVVAGLHTFLLRGDKEVLADGFKGYLQYLPAVKDSFKKAATGISVYGISKNSVRDISICLPDIPEQKAIASILSDMDTEITALEQRRDKTRSLKQAMMQELLTGKTRLL